MAANKVELQGVITVGDGAGCGPCTAPGSMKSQGMALRCAQSYEAVVSTDAPFTVATAGALGSAWDELPAVDALDKIELLFVRGASPMRLRVGADVAKVLGVAGTFPTGFVGAESLVVELDGVPLSVAFTSGAQTAQQVVNQVNAAAMLAGLTYLPASVSGGQVLIAGQLTGVQGSVEIVSGTALTALGLVAGTTLGAGSDVDFYGLYLVEYGRGQATAPSRIQISGSGSIEVFAAGTPA